MRRAGSPGPGLALLALALLLAATARSPLRADEASVRGLLTHIRSEVLDRYQGTHFGQVICLGDPARIRAALEWAALEVDPEKCRKRDAQGYAEQGAVYGASLYLRYDPARVPASEGAEYGETAWHESLHLTEYLNGDRWKDKNWNERHLDYFIALRKSVLDPLVTLERDARDPGVPDEALRNQWTSIRRAFEAGSGVTNPKYAVPGDLAAFEAWSGCRVVLADIENLYRSGSAGPRLKALFDTTALQDLTVSRVSVSTRPRRPGDSETVCDATVFFTLAGADPSMPWKGNADHFSTVRGPSGFQSTSRGSLGPRSLGYQDGSFSFRVPDSAGEGSFTLTCRVSAERLAGEGTASFTLSWPPTLLDVSGPASAVEGQPCTARTTVTDGVGPFQWSWKADGQGGSGSGTSFPMPVPWARRPAVTWTVEVRDRRLQARPADPPLTASLTVPVTPKAAPPAPPAKPPAPTGPELKLRIQGPRETAVNRDVSYTATASGGKGKVRFEWTTASGKTLPRPTITGRFGSPGPRTMTVRAWDEGRYQGTPQTASIQVEVYPELKGGIQGPTEAADGEAVQFRQDVQGGKGPLGFTWTAPNGRTLQKESLEGTIRGRPGEEKLLLLEVRDRLVPPQVLNLSHRLIVKDRGRIRITSLAASPSKLDAGQSSRVEVDFVVTGFKDPFVTATVTLWMENSSGSGLGLRNVNTFEVEQGRGYKAWAELPTHPQAREGPLTVSACVEVGDVREVAEASARIKRPGGLEDVTVDARDVVLRLWDHGSEDGDIVSVALNGVPLVQGYTLTNAGTAFRLRLNPGPNRLVVYAHNEGSSSPNTAAIQLDHVVRGPASQSYSLKTGTSGYFDIVAP